MGNGPGTWIEAKLSEKDFNRLASLIQEGMGIRMPSEKRVMMEARLRSRLRNLGLRTFGEYTDKVLDRITGKDERVHLVDAITTNKTDFFREPHHFEYLVQKAIPALVQSHGAGIGRKLAVWSAGCSSGEEPYSLAMVLSEVAQSLRGFCFRILATDISNEILNRAERAIYTEECVKPVPMVLKRKYLLRSKNPRKKLVQVSPDTRSVVKFHSLNLVGEFGLRERMDVIFCRNVMIYFERPTQEKLIKRFCSHLVPRGFLFLGHSESITGMDVPLKQVSPTVYRML